MAVGDVKSTARGSGARYNDGKAALELIPVWILAQWGKDTDKFDRLSPEAVLHELAAWQRGKRSAIDIIRRLEPGDALECARVFAYGAKKYAAWNWIRGMQWSVPLGCALRHTFAWEHGENLDPESGLTHRGHLVCNLVMLAQFERTFPEGDDRPVEWLSPTGVQVVRTGGSDSQEAFDAALAAHQNLQRSIGSPSEFEAAVNALRKEARGAVTR
jgi:hypothetical protein